MKKTIALLSAGLLSLSIFTGCSKDASSDDGKVKIEFFHYKREAIGSFDELIKKFEKENPNIDIEQKSPPEAETVLKTRIAKRDIPDVIGIGGNSTYKELAKAGVFEDVTKDSNLEKIQPAYIQMLKDVSEQDKVFAIPYAANAVGVIYNKAIFKELGLEVPKTWDEFIATAEKVKSASKIPFYFTFKDAWTTLPSFNALAANTQGDDFYDLLKEGKVEVDTRYKEAAEKFVQLTELGHKDQFGDAYSDGNTAFANGESAMYLQGVWAIPEIQKANPDIELGVFPFPAVNDTAKNKLVSGVDLQLSISSQTKHAKEAKKFVEFLLEEENAKTYIEEQKAFSAQIGIEQKDAILEGLQTNFDSGALTDFPDHYVPVGVALDKNLQTLAQKKDIDSFLDTLQSEWKKVQNRK
ncbi:ABC transporter substrate-binding protein [Niallia sp. NCCP-28]|uniref:ABC transporter substrate-binding protein n=1 Tax=Niallia sp. NCCP-28 TaxID=2934712 RepID=UPI0020899B6B|nr:extracellular solute-binding protein [Niallia sp. NCCP-28]GKU81849.1 ABC transporter substrate-binding protein [Niallia sp. NCCP-28]